MADFFAETLVSNIYSQGLDRIRPDLEQPVGRNGCVVCTSGGSKAIAMRQDALLWPHNWFAVFARRGSLVKVAGSL